MGVLFPDDPGRAPGLQASMDQAEANIAQFLSPEEGVTLRTILALAERMGNGEMASRARLLLRAREDIVMIEAGLAEFEDDGDDDDIEEP